MRFFATVVLATAHHVVFCSKRCTRANPLRAVGKTNARSCRLQGLGARKTRYIMCGLMVSCATSAKYVPLHTALTCEPLT
eukprot:4774243-Pyramimonas_sp.AAC.1